MRDMSDTDHNWEFLSPEKTREVLLALIPAVQQHFQMSAAKGPNHSLKSVSHLESPQSPEISN